MDINEARRLKELELENRRLKRAVADLTLREQVLKGDAVEKMVTPAARRAAVSHLWDRWSLRERQACRLASYSRSLYRRKSLRAEADEPPRRRLLELAAERPRFGYRRLHVMLVREGWSLNRKRVYWVYRELSLAVRRKKRKHVAQANRLPREVPIAANLQWSMNYMRDTLASGRVFRALNVVDDATREMPGDRGRHLAF